MGWDGDHGLSPVATVETSLTGFNDLMGDHGLSPVATVETSLTGLNEEK
jgi:hypothetical protein